MRKDFITHILKTERNIWDIVVTQRLFVGQIKVNKLMRAYWTGQDHGKGHVCLESLWRWRHLSKLPTWGGFIIDFSLQSMGIIILQSYVSLESEISIFEVLYIERRNSPSECGVTQYFWLIGYFQGSSSGLKNRINRGSFPLIFCTDTILGGDTSPKPRQRTGRLFSCL